MDTSKLKRCELVDGFKPGDKIVCICDDFPGNKDLNWSYEYPKAGETYTVRVSEPYWEDGTPAVRLEEIVNEEHYYSGLKRTMEAHWRASRFRPVLQA